MGQSLAREQRRRCVRTNHENLSFVKTINGLSVCALCGKRWEDAAKASPGEGGKAT